MTTKEQERKALEKIRAIVTDLGDNSYIGTAFDGAISLTGGFLCAVGMEITEEILMLPNAISEA